jgi:hypothetical protein
MGRQTYKQLSKQVAAQHNRGVVHYGASITDCGRDVVGLPASHRFTYSDGAVTCGECREARQHMKAKQR